MTAADREVTPAPDQMSVKNADQAISLGSALNDLRQANDFSGDFYEEDEPVEDVIAAFNAGEKGQTKPPAGWTVNLNLASVLDSAWLAEREAQAFMAGQASVDLAAADAAGYRRAVDRLRDDATAEIVQGAFAEEWHRDMCACGLWPYDCRTFPRANGGTPLGHAPPTWSVGDVLAKVGLYLEAVDQDASSTQPHEPQSADRVDIPAVPTVETPEAVRGAERVWAMPVIDSDVQAVWDGRPSPTKWHRYGLRRDWWVAPESGLDPRSGADLTNDRGPLTEVRDV